MNPTTVEHATLRERRKAQTRRELQAAAFALIAEHGYEDTTVHDIAAAANVSPRTFFRYFATKEEVVLWDEYNPLFIELFASRPSGEPLLESLRHVLDAVFVDRFEQPDRDLLLLQTKLIFGTPALRSRMWEQQLDLEQIAGPAVAERLGLSLDDFGVRVVVAAYFAVVMVAIDHWQQRDGRDDLRSLLDAALAHLSAGLRV